MQILNSILRLDFITLDGIRVFVIISSSFNTYIF